MNVTLPNGRVIEGVPEGTTKAQIMAKAISAGLATREDFAAQNEPSQQIDYAAREVAQKEYDQAAEEAKSAGRKMDALTTTSNAMKGVAAGGYALAGLPVKTVADVVVTASDDTVDKKVVICFARQGV